MRMWETQDRSQEVAPQTRVTAFTVLQNQFSKNNLVNK